MYHVSAQGVDDRIMYIVIIIIIKITIILKSFIGGDRDRRRWGGGGGGGGRDGWWWWSAGRELCLELHCLSDNEFCTKPAAMRAISILTQFIN